MPGFLILLFFLTLPIFSTGDFSALVSENQPQAIRLKTKRVITEGTVLNLPIDIPEPILSFDGKLPPKLKSISCYNSSGFYTIGDDLHIYLEYFSDVVVNGSPKVILNTGCNSPSCVTWEVQSFKCQATRGMFAMQLENEVIMNIDVNTTADRLEQYLRRFQRLHNVSVSIKPGNDNPMNENRVCSDIGNEVFITFFRVDFPEYHGDVPSILLNRFNNNPNPMTRLSQGVDTNFLKGTKHGDHVYLSENTTEVVKGANRTNIAVPYSYGNFTNRISFIYTVALGDIVDSLDVIGLDFSTGNISSRFGTGIVSDQLPPLGRGYRYMSSSAGSLSSTFSIGIASFLASVVNVTSPNATATYTVGDELFIDVTFDLAVRVTDASLFTLTLALSLFSRDATFHSLINNGQTLRFLYDIQVSDAAAVLETRSSTSLNLNGGKIFVRAGTKDLDAIITLPEPYSSTSLSAFKTLTINPNNPVVAFVRVMSPDGNYTAGDSIFLEAVFSTSVYVEGRPRIALSNTPREFDVDIMTAPHLPQLGYRRSFPSGVAQVKLQLVCNVEFAVGDRIILSLPRLTIIDPDITFRRRMSVDLYGDVAMNFTGFWHDLEKRLILTVNGSIPRFEEMEILIAGRSSLFVDSKGIGAPYEESIIFDAESIRSAYAFEIPIPGVEAVGYSNISLDIYPILFDSCLDLTFNIELPEYLSIGDSFVLHLFNFPTNVSQEQVSGSFSSSNLDFSYTYNRNDSTLTSVVVGSSNGFKSSSFTLVPNKQLCFKMPEYGIDTTSVLFSFDSEKNGIIDEKPIFYVPAVCSSPIDGSVGVFYYTSLSDVTSAVRFTFPSGLFGFVVGDKVLFTLAQLASQGFSNYVVDESALYGDLTSKFVVSVSGSTVTFTVTSAVSAGVIVEISIDKTVGMKTPSTGIQIENKDSFVYRVDSSLCSMPSGRVIPYSQDAQIIYLSKGSVHLNPLTSSFGSLTSIGISFDIEYPGLASSDMVIVTLPGFSRSINYILFNSSNIICAANVTAKFNRRVPRLEITFLEPFAGGSFTLNITSDALMYLPTTSISSTAFQLSAFSSLFGLVKGYTMVNQCIGFCSSSVTFSSQFTDEPLSISIIVSYSNVIPAGSSIDIKFVGIDVYSSVSIYQDGTPVSFLQTGDMYFNLTTISTVSAFTATTITISGVKHNENAIVSSSAVVYYYDSSFSGTASVVLDCPEVFTRPYFVQSNFTIDTSNINKFQLNLMLADNRVLVAGHFIDIKLNDFTYIGNSLETEISDSQGLLDTTASSYSAATETLRLVLQQTWTENTRVTIDVSEFSLPLKGLSANSTIVNYRIGFDSSVPSLITIPTAFGSVDEYITVSGVAVDLFPAANDSTVIEFIRLQFRVTAALHAGEKIYAMLPRLSLRDVSVSTSVSIGVMGNVRCTSVWDKLNNGIVTTLLEPSDLDIDLIFNTTSSTSTDFMVHTTGIPEGSRVYLTAMDVQGNIIANGTGLLPCVGICDISLQSMNKNPGRSTGFFLNATFGNVLLNFGDHLDLFLTDFSSLRPDESYNISCSSMSDPEKKLFSAFWFSDSSILRIQYLPQVFAYGSELQSSLYCIIPQDFNLQLPINGIRATDVFTANLSLTNSGVITNYMTDIVRFDSVGAPIQSAITISPKQSSVPVGIRFSFSFEDYISVGDIIKIYLPNFIVPSRSIQVFSSDSHSVRVVGYAADTKELTNPDGSIYFEESIGRLEVELLSSITAGDMLDFNFTSDAGVISPHAGLFTVPFPWFSVESITSPISGVTFQNITKIGTLSPAALDFVDTSNSTLKMYDLHLNFTLFCPLLENDTLFINMPILSVISSSANIAVQEFNSSRKASVGFSSVWLNDTSTIAIQLVQGYILSGDLYIRLRFYGFDHVPIVVYPGDEKFYYESSSTICPIASTPFDAAPTFFVASSNVALIPIPGGDGRNVYVSFSIKPSIDLLSGDVLELNLDKIAYNEVCFNGICDLSLTQAQRQLLQKVQLVAGNGTSQLVFTLARSIPAQSTLRLLSSSLTNGSFSMTQYVIEPSDVSFSLVRNMTSVVTNVTVDTVIFSGNVQTISLQPYLLSSSIIVHTPVAASMSGITVNFQFSGAISIDDRVTIFLPTFTMRTGYPSSWIYVNDDATQQFVVQWDGSAQTLSLIPRLRIPAVTEISLIIEASRGLFLPVAGIPVVGFSFILTLFRSSSVIFRGVIDDVTNVPYISLASISFLSCDTQDSFSFGGNSHALQLVPGHELTSGDVGAMISINGTVYFIAGLHDNVLFLESEYLGSRVFLGSPDVIVTSPSYRFANYINGSGTSTLVFEYHVDRGDQSQYLSIYPLMTDIDLNNGKILRYSMKPKLPSALQISLFQNNFNKKVNTDFPVVTRIYTTSPDGAYSVGQHIDIWLEFSDEVVLETLSPVPVPKIILLINNTGYGYAHYDMGTSTNKLVFLYEVQAADLQLQLSSVIFNEDDPIYQPLRIITGNTESYLFRKARSPFLPADLRLGNSAFEFPNSQMWVGKVAKVESLSVISVSSLISNIYTAGETIEIAVRFTHDISVTVSSVSTLGPYIVLDVGNGRTSNAFYTYLADSRTAVFSYEFSPYDMVSNGLYLACECKDYLQRTFIQTNGSSIVSSEFGLPAALMIASSSDSASLLVDDNVVVDNDIPHVVSIYSNVTSGIYAPGSAVKISVIYSAPVMVMGLVSLKLRGEFSFCRAGYFNGNGTSTLTFLYHVSLQSGVARLECTDADAIDLSFGKVFKLSTVAVIEAINELPSPGAPDALGRIASIIIDPTPATFVKMEVLHTQSSDEGIGPILATRQVPFNLPRFQFETIFEQCGCDTLKSSPVASQEILSLIGKLDSEYFIFNETSQGHPFQYYRYLLSSLYAGDIEALPSSIQRCFNWWKTYEVSDSLLLSLQFNRPVDVENAVLAVSDNDYMAIAVSSNHHCSYILTIKNVLRPSEDTYFLFRSNGIVSPCLPQSADAETIREALKSMPPINIYQPIVENPILRENLYFDFAISLQRDVELELVLGHDADVMCTKSAAMEDVQLLHDNDEVLFKYNVQSGDALVFLTDTNLPVGSYQVNFTGPVLGQFGVERNEFNVKQLSPYGFANGSSSIISNRIGRITMSSLYFGSVYPGDETFFRVEICSSTQFAVGDKVSIHFPNFNYTNFANGDFADTSTVSAFWSSGNSSIVFTFLAQSFCIGNENIKVDYPIVLRNQGIYRNDPSFTFSVSSAEFGNIDDIKFDLVSPVGFSRLGITFNDTRPYQPTELQLVFESLIDLEIGNDTLSLHLPGFYAADIKKVDISIAGSLSNLIEARWSNKSSTLFLSPLVYIPAGFYNFTIQSSLFPITVGPLGISADAPPSLRVTDPMWSMIYTPLQAFPIIYGYRNAYVEFSVNSSYYVNEVILHLYFSRNVRGPAEIQLIIPGLEELSGLVFIDGASVVNGGYDNATWFNFNHTWLFRSDSGWDQDEDVGIRVTNLENFKINELGIFSGIFSGLSFSVKGADGEIAISPISVNDSIPIISNGKFSLSNLEIDAFHTGLDSMSISFHINTFPTMQDIFRFRFDDLVLNLTNSHILDPCYNITSWSVDTVQRISFIDVGLANGSTTCFYRRVRNIVLEIDSVQTNIQDRRVKQYNQRYAWYSWITENFQSDFFAFDESVWVGLYSSSVNFVSPYAGKVSEVEVKLLTATKFAALDTISLTLPGLQVPWSISKVLDQFQREWEVLFSNSTSVLTLVVPRSLLPAALTFKFHNLVVPSAGVSFNHSSTFSVELARPSVSHSLLPDIISFVTPVGLIVDGNVRLRRTTLFGENLFSFMIELETLNPLFAGDAIDLVFENVLFRHPSILLLEDNAEENFKIETTSLSTIRVTVFDQQLTHRISLSIQPSANIVLNNNADCVGGNTCVTKVDISSFSNPVKDYSIACLGNFLETGTSVVFVYKDRYPSANITFNATQVTKFNSSDNLIGLTFNFTLQQLLPTSGHIILNLDSMLNMTGIDPLDTIILSSTTEADWNVSWYNNSRILFAPSHDLGAGNYSIGLKSLFFDFDKDILFENEITLSYELYDGTTYSDRSFITNVGGWGLRFASIDWQNPIPSYESPLLLKVASIETFLPGDVIIFQLPGVKCYNFSAVPIVKNFDGTLTWDSSNSRLILSVNRGRRKEIQVSTSSGFFLPEVGVSSLMNAPSVAFNRTSRGMYYGFTTLSNFQTFAPILHSNISFSPHTPFEWSTVHLVLTTQGMEIAPGDVLTLQLPQFSSFAEVLTISDSAQLANWTAVWSSCDETVYISLSKDELEPIYVTSLTFSIGKLRLPPLGVSSSLELGISLKLQPQVYNSVETSKTHVEHVGFADASSLAWYPARLDEFNAAYVSLRVSLALDVGDEIVLKFPGLNISSSCSANLLPIGSMSTDFNRSMDTLTLIATTHIPSFETIQINTSACFLLHSSGFPDVSRTMVDYSITVTTARYGVLENAPFQNLSPIGVISAKLTADVVDIEKPLSLRFDLELSTNLQFLDTIHLHIPVLNYTIVDVDNVVPLSLRGDWAETNFKPFFEGTLYPDKNLIVLTCNESVVSRRRFSVYIGMDNLVGLGLNTSSHVFMSANITQIGPISKVPVIVSPMNIPVVRNTMLAITSCDANRICQYLLKFELAEELPAQSSIALSSSSWTLPGNHSLKIDNGGAPSLFSPHWRYADNTESMLVPRQNWETMDGVGSDWTSADLNVLSVDKLIPDDILLPWSAIVTTDIPRVINFGFLNWTYSSVLAYEDAMLFIEFSQPVEVYTYLNTAPRLMLNTGEYANYWSGSGTNMLIFKYTPFIPNSVESVSIAGSAGLEIYSSGLIMSSSRANVAANLTVSPPFELYQFNEGYRKTVKVSPTASAEVLSIYEFSRNITYGSGDILDIGVVFNRPISVEGFPELALHYVGDMPVSGGTTDRYYGLRYINVSYIQYLNVEVPGYFAVKHDSYVTPCLSAEKPAEIVSEMSKLPSLAWSLPISIRRIANDDVAMQYKLTFHGVAPTLLSVQTEQCDPRATVSFAIDSNMLNQMVFRTEIKASYPSGNLTYFNYTSLVLRNQSSDSANIALAAFKRIVNDSLLSPPEGIVKIDNSQPFVLNVSSNFYFTERRVAVSGDTISIVVEFNAKIIPRGNIFLEILVENLLDPSIRARNISWSSFHNQFLVFEYVVEMGDVTSTLTSSRLVTFSNSSVFRLSRIPSVVANLDLPGITDGNSLYASHIVVNATDLPKIMRVYNMGNDTILNAGMSTLVGIQFSSAVQLLPTNTSAWIIPFIPLVSPAERTLTYFSGAGTSLWVFNYTVRASDATGNMDFYFSLVGGKGKDNLNQTFSNLSISTLYTVENLYVNTIPPYVVKVDCNCNDGTYYPGQVLDIFVQFNEPIVMISPSSDVLRLPQLEIFTHTQYGENVLANYWYGNGTTELHFRYIVPPPNINALPHLPFALDYAGVLALRSYLNGVELKSLSPNPETKVNDLLPTMDTSYLVYERQLYLNLAWSRVESVSLTRKGIYTVGDVISIMVNFTTPVMFSNPAPFFILHLDNDNVTAKYSHGNRTKTLWFTYVVEAGDSVGLLDYIQTDMPPYKSDILDYSFPLIAFDDYKKNLFGKVQIGLFMLSEIQQYGVPVPFPLPGTAGSISDLSPSRVDSSVPRILSVTTLEPSGTYGYPQVLTIYVSFSWPVIVSGCPRLVFVVQGVVRYATYKDGSGTDTLVFEFAIAKSDFKLEFDYESPYSFELESCSKGSFSSGENTYIRRMADTPTLNANLTMPFVNFRPTITSPSSILATGINITLAGDTAVTTRVATSAAPEEIFSFGDFVDLQVIFTGPVMVKDPFNWLEVGSAAELGILYQNALFTNQSDSITVNYGVIPAAYDSLKNMSYLNSISLKSSNNCAFKEADGDCVAQNLPWPNRYANDELTPKNISIKSSRERAKLVALEFSFPTGKQYFASGDPVNVIGTFSEPVTVVGQPILRISINETYSFALGYEKAVSLTQLQFTRVVGLDTLSGVLQCGRLCQIDTANGLVLRRANFLPLVNADITLQSKRCYDPTCSQIDANLFSGVPFIVKVFSNATGVQTLNDTISIFVEFSSPVKVKGSPRLLLSLYGTPFANFVNTGSYVNGTFVDGLSLVSTIVLFQYKARPVDRTSALEYASIDSLIVLDDVSETPVNTSTSRIGIFSASQYSDKHVNYILPVPGSETSLGVTSAVVIDQSRPNVISITTEPETSSTCGDVVMISLIYNQPMALVSTISPALNTPPRTQIKLSLSLVSSANELLKSLFATFGNLTENILTFSLPITSSEPVGRIILGSKAPLILGQYSLQSKFTRVSSPVVFDDALVSSFGIAVVRNLPVVLSVFSPNTTTSYSYGVGDVLFIEVMFNVPVRVDNNEATLDLSLDGVVRVASFNGLKAGNTIIEFVYAVQGDDRTDRLTYVDSNALKGKIFQISQCDAPVPANLTLPVPGSPDSLSGCCPISIDSSPPFIRAVFPVKVQGTYGENEPLLVIVRFSIPVVVVGYPYLMLQVGTNRTAAANYTPTAIIKDSFQDLTIELMSTDVGFVYYIDVEDNIDNVIHAGPDALVVGPTSGRILQLSDNPAFEADTSLRNPSDLSKELGSVSRQWKYRFFQSMDIILRDIYHTNPQSLSVVVNHEGTSGVVFQGCCREGISNPQPRTFGYNKNYYTAGTISSVLATEEDFGEDLIFSDSTAPNIALLQGKASQSTTIRDASLAIDGGYSPVVGDESVSETVQEDNPWWHLAFNSPQTPVQTIAIYERLPQTWVQPVVQFTIKGLDRLPSGFFRIRFSNFNPANASDFAITSFIKIGAEAESVLRAIVPLSPLGNVLVEKRALPLCVVEGRPETYGGGCGVGVDYGYGAVYKLTFLSLLVPDPVVELVDLKYPGEPLQANGTASSMSLSAALYLSQKYPISLKVKRIRSGYYKPVFKQYQGELPGEDTSLTNQWLTPFYVFMFNASVSENVPTNITIAKQKAIWYQEITSIDKVRIITLPKVYEVASIRIQRVGSGQLSLTEVAVYSSALRGLDAYNRGSPVQNSELGSLYNPATPFRSVYSEMTYDGLWVVTVTQGSSGWTVKDGVVPQGSISEAVIVVTDLAGVVTTYYQDIYAVVETLPRYGTLFTTQSGSLLGYTSWHEAFGLIYGQPIVPDVARSIHLGQCAADANGNCIQNVPGSRNYRLELTQQVKGDRPLLKTILRSERILYYIPDPKFRGQDFFTYSTYFSSSIQQQDQTVTLVVQPCRLFLNRTTSFGSQLDIRKMNTEEEPEATATTLLDNGKYWSMVSDSLCHCAPSPSKIISDESLCAITRMKLCQHPMLRHHFYDMCLSCYGNSLAGNLLESNYRSNDAENCRSLTIKATSLLLLRGLCANVTSPIISVNEGASQLNTNGTTTYTAYFSSRGIGVGRQAIIPDECLIPHDYITESQLLRRNFISAQQKPPSRD